MSIERYSDLELHKVYLRDIGEEQILSIYIGYTKSDVYFYDIDYESRLMVKENIDIAIKEILSTQLKRYNLISYNITIDGAFIRRNIYEYFPYKDIKVSNIDNWYRKNLILNSKLPKIDGI